jgi:streptogramin lyase
MTSGAVRELRARTMFRGPGEQINGLEAVPEGLWLCDQQNNRAYLVDYNGATLTSFPGPVRNASGISFGAGSVWTASNVPTTTIYRHDPATGHCLAALVLRPGGGVHGIQWRPYEVGETPPAVVEAAPELHPSAPGGKPHGEPGSSGTLWVTRPGAKLIEHIDAETGDLLGTIPFPTNRSHGLFWDEADGSLCVADTNIGEILRLDPRDGTVRERWHVAGSEVHGLTRSADGRIWIADAATNEILVVEG